MAGEDEKIDIYAEMRDEVSRPARTAAKSIDELGDEAQQTAAQLEEMSKAEDDAADNADKLARKSELAAKRLEQQQRALKQTRDAYGRFIKAENEAADSSDRVTESTDRQERSLRKLWRTLTPFGGSGGKNTLGFFGKLWGFFKGKMGRAAFWIAIGTGISFLGTAIEGLGAASIAAVAGLAPLTGMLVAYPGIIGTVLQAFGTLKLATSGMGELISTLSNPEATAEEIEKAMKGMAQSQVRFARAVADSADGWKEVKKSVGGKFFQGLDTVYKNLTKTYMPIADKYLTRTAGKLNTIVKMSAGWLQSEKGQKEITQIMDQNVYSTEQYGHALLNVVRIITGLVHAAGPMLRSLSTDIRGITGDWARATEKNQFKLQNFFNNAYDLFKRVGTVLGTYMHALWNIGKESGALSKFMGNSLEDIGKRFEAWTESKSGKKDIRQWFNDMIPIVKELGYWLRDLAKAAGEITMGNGDFLDASKALRTEGLPLFVDAFKATSGQVVPLVRELSDTYASLKEAGIAGGIGRALHGLVDGIQYAADIVAQLPPDVKNLIGWATGIFAAYKLIDRFSGGGAGSLLQKIRSGMGGGNGSILGIQKVFVVNWPTSMGGQGVDWFGTGSEPDKDKNGKPKKAPKTRAAAKGIAGVVATVAGTLGLDYLAKKMPDSKGKPDPFLKGASRGGATGAALAATFFGPEAAPAGFALGAGGGGVYNMYRESGFMGGPSKAPKTQTPSANPFLPPPASIDLPNGGSMANPQFKIWMDNIDENTRKMKEWNDNAEASVHAWVKMGGAADTASGDLKGVGTVLDKDVGVAAIQARNKMDQLKRMADDFNHPYTPKVEVLGADAARQQAEGVSSALNGITDKSVTLHVGVDSNFNLATGGAFNSVQDFLEGKRFAGGDTKAGANYLVGERGPEAWISKSGQMKMLGVNGPEIAAPGAGAVIPHSATKDPYGGSYGLAPGWAKEAFRKAAEQAPSASGKASGGGTFHADVSVGPFYGDVNREDVTQGVLDALDQAKKDWEDRQ